MFKKTITYKDYDGIERTEDFYFNLTKAEVMQMEIGTDGGMQKMLEKIVAEKDNKRIMEVFTDILMRAYGEKSADGKHFVKSPEISKAFTQTEAYSDMFMEMLTDAKAASAFINGIVPKDVAQASAEKSSTENAIPTLIPRA